MEVAAPLPNPNPDPSSNADPSSNSDPHPNPRPHPNPNQVAGLGPSRVVAVVKARDKPVGLGLQVTSCGVGTLVSEIDPHGSAAGSAMKAGDIILAIDSVVPTSPKHAVQLFMQAEYIANVVVIGHEPDAR